VDPQQILKTLGEILGDVLGGDPITLSRTTIAPDVDGWDSFENIRFIVAVERHYSVRFASGDVLDLKNVGEFVDLIVDAMKSNS
jgi:acyl carrier protein